MSFRRRARLPSMCSMSSRRPARLFSRVRRHGAGARRRFDGSRGCPARARCHGAARGDCSSAHDVVAQVLDVVEQVLDVASMVRAIAARVLDVIAPDLAIVRPLATASSVCSMSSSRSSTSLRRSARLSSGRSTSSSRSSTSFRRFVRLSSGCSMSWSGCSMSWSRCSMSCSRCSKVFPSARDCRARHRCRGPGPRRRFRCARARGAGPRDWGRGPRLRCPAQDLRWPRAGRIFLSNSDTCGLDDEDVRGPS